MFEDGTSRDHQLRYFMQHNISCNSTANATEQVEASVLGKVAHEIRAAVFVTIHNCCLQQASKCNVILKSSDPTLLETEKHMTAVPPRSRKCGIMLLTYGCDAV